MAVAIKKILYAADDNEDALAEAQEIVSEMIINTEQTELSDDNWRLTEERMANSLCWLLKLLQ